ncbi:MAG TPA: protein kinase [Stellaceae bacterium]|nr:protein kinase [Stellaceae bacterium]
MPGIASMSPQHFIAHYRIVSKLGEGGMGEVWRATDTKLGREVAIKVLPDVFARDADRMARFQREAQVLASLNHPNIAAIYGVEERALVMELVEGVTLAERVAQGPIPLDEALDIARQIGEALEAAHDKGIVHRDLKPANIKLTPDGRVKVLDFGLAKAMAGDAAIADPVNSPTLTMQATVAGVILGTAGYMAPEQAKGRPVDRRADIWAFGVVLYEMLSGRTLFAGETLSETLAALLTREPDLGPIPPKVRNLLRSCLEKDPRKRLRDIGDAWRLVEQPSAPATTPVPAARRAYLPWIAASVLGVIAITLAALHFGEALPQTPVTRFTIFPPEKGAFGQWLALSPDGRHLAFTGIAGDGGLRIWLRSFDSLELRSLVTAEGSGTFTVLWSPDSRFLVYQSAGKIRKIDIAGGPPQTLCDAPPVMLGGSWNKDGVILFGSNSGPIQRVPSTGGKAEPVTQLEQSRNEALHTDPIFLPDGAHFIYIRQSGKAEQKGVYVGSIEAKPAAQSLKRIAATEFSAGFAPARGSAPAYLLFLREDTLMAQPFDLRRMETMGEMLPIAEQIGTSISRSFFSVSREGTLAYRSGIGTSSQLISYDRQGHPAGNFIAGLELKDPAFSPDASRVLYSGDTGAPLRELWLYDIARGIQSRLTFLPEGAQSGVWSPDGQTIAFAPARQPGIYLMDAGNAGEPKRIFDSGLGAALESWSSDGRFLVYGEARHGYDVVALPLSGSGNDRHPIPIAASDAAEMHGQVSPDSQWVAYDSDESGKAEVFIRPFPPSGERAGKWQVSSLGGSQPRWRGDGKELFYIDPDHHLMAVDIQLQPRFQSGVPHALFTTPAISGRTLQYQYDVTRDGKRFVLVAPAAGAVSAPATVVQNWQGSLRK